MITRECIVYLNKWPHMGEPVVATGKHRIAEDGAKEIEVVSFSCQHGEFFMWIRREDIS